MREMVFFFVWGMVLYLTIVWLNFADFFPFVELMMRLMKKVPKDYELMKRVRRDSQMLAHNRKWRGRMLFLSLVYVCCYWLIVWILTPAAAFLVSFVVAICCFGVVEKKEKTQRRQVEELIKTTWR